MGNSTIVLHTHTHTHTSLDNPKPTPPHSPDSTNERGNNTKWAPTPENPKHPRRTPSSKLKPAAPPGRGGNHTRGGGKSPTAGEGVWGGGRGDGGGGGGGGGFGGRIGGGGGTRRLGGRGGGDER